MRFGNNFAVPVNGAEPISTCGKHQHFPIKWLIDNHLVNWNSRRTVSFPERLHEPHPAFSPKSRWNLSALPTQRLSHPIVTSIFYLDTRAENVSVNRSMIQYAA